MINEKNYIGFELAKKLFENGCKIEFSKIWEIKKGIYGNEHNRTLISFLERYQAYKHENNDIYPTFHYYDILVTYVDDFFDILTYAESASLLGSLRCKKNNQADRYIWEICKFNPENKNEVLDEMSILWW